MTGIFDYRIPLDIGTRTKIIDAFVSIYGEERRPLIEERLSKTQIFLFNSDKEISKKTVELRGLSSDSFLKTLDKLEIPGKKISDRIKFKVARKLVYRKFRHGGFVPRRTRLAEGAAHIISKEIRKMKVKTILNDLAKIKFLSPYDEKELTKEMTPGRSWCSPEFVQTDNGMEVVPIIMIDMTGDPNAVDQIIFHELNHAIETTFKPTIGDDKCEIDGGWIKNIYHYDGTLAAERQISKTGEEKDLLFDEIINELLAEKAARNFHAQGHSIVSDPKNATYYDCCYRDVEFLVKDFLTVYQEPIIKSRLGESDELFEVIGRDNFDKFSSLLDEYEMNYSKTKSTIFFPGSREKTKEKIEKLKKESLSTAKEILEKMKLHVPTEEKSSAMGM